MGDVGSYGCGLINKNRISVDSVIFPQKKIIISYLGSSLMVEIKTTLTIRYIYNQGKNGCGADIGTQKPKLRSAGPPNKLQIKMF